MSGFDWRDDDPGLTGYRTALLRPRLTKLRGLSAGQIDNVLTELAHHGIVLSPHAHQTLPSAPDPGDRFLGGPAGAGITPSAWSTEAWSQRVTIFVITACRAKNCQ